jgi:hypothetical protein
MIHYLNIISEATIDLDMDELNLCMTEPGFSPVWEGTGSCTMKLIKHLSRNVNVHVVTLKRNKSNLVKMV